MLGINSYYSFFFLFHFFLRLIQHLFSTKLLSISSFSMIKSVYVAIFYIFFLVQIVCEPFCVEKSWRRKIFYYKKSRLVLMNVFQVLSTPYMKQSTPIQQQQVHLWIFLMFIYAVQKLLIVRIMHSYWDVCCIIVQNCDKVKDPEAGKQDLRSRGLCLVPISSTFPVANETTADFWTPTFGGTFR